MQGRRRGGGGGGGVSAMNDAVKVAVRVRPMSAMERGAGVQNIISVQDNSCVVVDPTAFSAAAAVERECGEQIDMSTWARKFNYDHCYWSAVPEDPHYADQSTVYRDIGLSILEQAWEGYNCSVFSYGQTGAGKSYCMMGTGAVLDDHVEGKDYGLTPRICSGLFQGIAERLALTSSDARAHMIAPKYCVEVSYLEIYNELVRDLFNPESAAASTVGPRATGARGGLRVREHPTSGAYVEGLTVVTVHSYSEIEQLIAFGGKARTVASTNMNENSSRSHAIFTLTFRQASISMGNVQGKATGAVGDSGGRPRARAERERGEGAGGEGRNVKETVSCVNLVDLAGSERVLHTGATGIRLKEAGSINKSLATLSDVVKALTDAQRDDKKGGKGAFIPYRNSVLTRLLKESLGGNARTVMLACVSPCDVHFEETMSTLKYAERAKKVRTHAVVNEDSNETLVAQLTAEVAELRRQLQLRGGGEPGVPLTFLGGGVQPGQETERPSAASGGGRFSETETGATGVVYVVDPAMQAEMARLKGALAEKEELVRQLRRYGYTGEEYRGEDGEEHGETGRWDPQQENDQQQQPQQQQRFLQLREGPFDAQLEWGAGEESQGRGRGRAAEVDEDGSKLVAAVLRARRGVNDGSTHVSTYRQVLPSSLSPSAQRRGRVRSLSPQASPLGMGGGGGGSVVATAAAGSGGNEPGSGRLINDALPRLVNLNQDPLFSECLVYYIREGITTVGSGEECEIQLCGLDMLPKHVVLTHQHGMVMLHPLGGARVYVNGSLVGGGGESGLMRGEGGGPTIPGEEVDPPPAVMLTHRCRVVCGRHHVLRFEQAAAALSITEEEARRVGGQVVSPGSASTEVLIDWEFAQSELLRKNPQFALALTTPCAAALDEAGGEGLDAGVHSFQRELQEKVRRLEAERSEYIKRLEGAEESLQELRVSSRGPLFPSSENGGQRGCGEGMDDSDVGSEFAAAVKLTLPSSPLTLGRLGVGATWAEEQRQSLRDEDSPFRGKVESVETQHADMVREEQRAARAKERARRSRRGGGGAIGTSHRDRGNDSSNSSSSSSSRSSSTSTSTRNNGDHRQEQQPQQQQRWTGSSIVGASHADHTEMLQSRRQDGGEECARDRRPFHGGDGNGYRPPGRWLRSNGQGPREDGGGAAAEQRRDRTAPPAALPPHPWTDVRDSDDSETEAESFFEDDKTETAFGFRDFAGYTFDGRSPLHGHRSSLLSNASASTESRGATEGTESRCLNARRHAWAHDDDDEEEEGEEKERTRVLAHAPPPHVCGPTRPTVPPPAHLRHGTDDDNAAAAAAAAATTAGAARLARFSEVRHEGEQWSTELSDMRMRLESVQAKFSRSRQQGEAEGLAYGSPLATSTAAMGVVSGRRQGGEGPALLAEGLEELQRARKEGFASPRRADNMPLPPRPSSPPPLLNTRFA